MGIRRSGNRKVNRSGPLHILVVDDNRDSADALAWLLQTIGHEARAVYDGACALRAVEQDSPDLIIQDLGLPEMNGYEVARRVRKLPAARHAVLVAVTGQPRADAVGLAKEAGFDHLLLKPVGLAALEEVLARVAPQKNDRAQRLAGG